MCFHRRSGGAESESRRYCDHGGAGGHRVVQRDLQGMYRVLPHQLCQNPGKFINNLTIGQQNIRILLKKTFLIFKNSQIRRECFLHVKQSHRQPQSGTGWVCLVFQWHERNWSFKCCISQSGPRCVARFDFEGEHSDELSFSEGDVIQLNAYVGQDWARGQMGTSVGIFPLNFVEVIEDLPPPPSQQLTQPNQVAEAAKPAEVRYLCKQRRGQLCCSTRRTGSPVCFTSSSIVSAGWSGVGGGSVWLCWKFRRRPVLSAGRLHSDQPPHWFWVELRSARWQRGYFPQGFCWERRYDIPPQVYVDVTEMPEILPSLDIDRLLSALASLPF